MPDYATNTDREMRSQQTDGEEGDTATDVGPHEVGTVASSPFFKVGYGSQILERENGSVHDCKQRPDDYHIHKKSAVAA